MQYPKKEKIKTGEDLNFHHIMVKFSQDKQNQKDIDMHTLIRNSSIHSSIISDL